MSKAVEDLRAWLERNHEDAKAWGAGTRWADFVRLVGAVLVECPYRFEASHCEDCGRPWERKSDGHSVCFHRENCPSWAKIGVQLGIEGKARQ